MKGDEVYMTLEGGEYGATSDDGRVRVERESALGAARVYLDAEYVAGPKLVEALRGLFTHCVMVHRYGGEIDNTREANAAIEATVSVLHDMGIEVKP